MVMLMARPIGDGGDSTTSSAAGRTASSNSRRRSGSCSTLGSCGSFGNFMICLADVMNTGLQVVELGVAPVRPHQLVVRAVLDDAAALDSNDAIGAAHGREPVRDDQDRAAL